MRHGVIKWYKKDCVLEMHHGQLDEMLLPPSCRSAIIGIRETRASQPHRTLQGLRSTRINLLQAICGPHVLVFLQQLSACVVYYIAVSWCGWRPFTDNIFCNMLYSPKLPTPKLHY